MDGLFAKSLTVDSSTVDASTVDASTVAADAKNLNFQNEDFQCEGEPSAMAVEEPFGETQDLVSAPIARSDGLSDFAPKDWRAYFASKLTGKGLEIGPLHRPMVTHAQMRMDYIDRCTVAELREHYPELNELNLVAPDILGDGETLRGVADGAYDFLVSAHVIEHTKSPLAALEQWWRVIKPGGLIYLIVPDKRMIFDKNRVRTTLEHLILDYLRPCAQRDYEHYLDYALHVHDKHGSEAIAEADRLIQTDYSIHFHVFLPSDIVRLVQWFDRNIRPLEIVEGPCAAPGSDEFHLLLQKKGEG